MPSTSRQGEIQVLTNPSQIVLRNSHLIENHRVLLLNYEGDLLGKELVAQATHIEALALDYHHHLMLSPLANSQLAAYFGHKLPHDDLFDTVVVFFPKAKALAPYLFNLAARHLTLNGQLHVVGENKGGIKSLAKMLPSYFSAPSKLDNARHCLLFGSERVDEAPSIKIADWVTQYQLETPKGPLTICNLVGVFSDKQLDQGTELLLQHLPKLSGRVLDFGCGAGVIAAALLKEQPELILECVDINAMALASCELTMQANGFSANIYPSDGLAQTAGLFDSIISNPPFHDGLSSTTDIATQFVRDSARCLAKGGQWHIVANRHLPYASTIASHFLQFSVSAENNKYKVYSTNTDNNTSKHKESSKKPS